MSTTASVNNRKRHGQHYTPTALADFLAEEGVVKLEAATMTVAVLDPACGDGELLFAAHRAISKLLPSAKIRLVGYDIDEAAITASRQRAEEQGIAVELSNTDFLSRAEEHRHEFDLVITNPPYVRTQQLGGALARTLAERFGLTGRIDLTHPFVTVAPTVLTESGVLALLCSNRFLTTKAGANMRSVLTRQLHTVALYDLGDSKLFEAAVLPAIVVATKQPQAARCKFAASYEAAAGANGQPTHDLFAALRRQEDSVATQAGRTFEVRVGTLDAGDPSAPWRMSGRRDDAWLDAVRTGTWKTFGEVAKIRVGIKTTADSVFLSDQWHRLADEDRPESEVLLPLTTHRNAQRWSSDAGDYAVLYPYDLTAARRVALDMERYPRAFAYLKKHHDRLAGRKYVIEAGRQWYEIWVPQKPAMWAVPKIVFPDISEEPRFSWDESGAVVNGDCYWMSLEDIGDERLAMLMLGVANSGLATRFYDLVCGNKLYAGKRRWISQYVSKFPLPDPRSSAAEQIVGLTRAFIARPHSINADSLQELDDAVERAFRENASEFLF